MDAAKKNDPIKRQCDNKCIRGCFEKHKTACINENGKIITLLSVEHKIQ